MTTALAIFVKTPGLSPIKTRLATNIGQNKAEEFYQYSLKAISQVIATVQQVSNGMIQPIWAVAEHDGILDPRWKNFPCLFQGEGELGDRLFQIYRSLQNEYESVIMIGADSPQLKPIVILESLERLKSQTFVVGPSYDGGFYLFGGRRDIPLEMWNSIPYSSNLTLEKLIPLFSTLGSISLLSKEIDVDNFDDLQFLSNSLAECVLEEQKKLYKWLQSFQNAKRNKS